MKYTSISDEKILSENSFFSPPLVKAKIERKEKTRPLNANLEESKCRPWNNPIKDIKS
jgi:hypothetical protein